MSRRTPTEPRWASLADAAEYAAVPYRTVRDWIARGVLPGYRIGPRLLQVNLNDIDKLRRRVPAVSSTRSE